MKNISPEINRLIKTTTNLQLSDSLRVSASRELLIRLEDSADISVKVQTHLLLGNLLKGDLRQEQYELGFGLANEFRLQELKAELLNKLGIVFRKKKDFSKAIGFHKQAIDLTGKEERKASYLNSLGVTFMEKNDHEAARDVFAEANFLNLKNADLAKAASVYNNLGLIAQREARYGESLFNYEKALEIRLQLQDSVEMARTLKNRSIVYNKSDQRDEAIQDLEISIEIFRQYQMTHQLELASALNSLGASYFNLNQFDLAEPLYRESEKIRKEIGNLSGLSGSYNNLGSLFRSIGKLDSAGYYYDQSIKLKHALGRKTGLAINYLNISEFAIDQRRFDEARYLLDSAMWYSKHYGNDRLLVSCLISEARYYSEKKELSNAKKSLDKALVSLAHVNMRDLLLEAYDLYRKIYFKENNTTKAQAFDNKYDSLNNEVAIARLVRLGQLKTQMKDEREEAIQNVREMEFRSISARKAERRGRWQSLLFVTPLVVLVFIWFRLSQKRKRKRLALVLSKQEEETMKANKKSATLENEKSKVEGEKSKLQIEKSKLEGERLKLETGLKDGPVFMEKKVAIPNSGKQKDQIVLIAYKELILVMADNYHTDWYLTDGRSFTVRYSLDSLEKKFAQKGLLRSHRSWIVNTQFVDKGDAKSDGAMLLILTRSVEIEGIDRDLKKDINKNTRTRSVPLSKTHRSKFEDYFPESS